MSSSTQPNLKSKPIFPHTIGILWTTWTRWKLWFLFVFTSIKLNGSICWIRMIGFEIREVPGKPHIKKYRLIYSMQYGSTKPTIYFFLMFERVVWIYWNRYKINAKMLIWNTIKKAVVKLKKSNSTVSGLVTLIMIVFNKDSNPFLTPFLLDLIFIFRINCILWKSFQ